MGAGMFLNSMDPAHTSKLKLIYRLSYYAEQIILCYAYKYELWTSQYPIQHLIEIYAFSKHTQLATGDKHTLLIKLKNICWL